MELVCRDAAYLNAGSRPKSAMKTMNEILKTRIAIVLTAPIVANYGHDERFQQNECR